MWQLLITSTDGDEIAKVNISRNLYMRIRLSSPEVLSQWTCDLFNNFDTPPGHYNITIMHNGVHKFNWCIKIITTQTIAEDFLSFLKDCGDDINYEDN